MISALYVIHDGPYVGLAGVDPWPKERDARGYLGPWPVVAHPECGKWGRYAKVNGTLGQDDGCFMYARLHVTTYGGVLEHPEGSHAFYRYGLPIPVFGQGWSAPDLSGGRSIAVDQGQYGHRARKRTWLYACKIDFDIPIDTRATPPKKYEHLPPEKRKRAIKTGECQRMSHRQRKVTPEPFRDLLLRLADSASVTPKDKSGG